MLVQFALLAIGLLGLAALTVDMGLLRVTQSTMQTAADSAALEGVRFRNHVGGDVGDADEGDGFASDCTRRLAASRLVAWTFDDNLDPAGGDPRSFGAGPAFAIAGGQGDADALGRIDVTGPSSYKPRLELNQSANRIWGDLVSGAFTYSSTPPPDEEVDFSRADFLPSEATPPPGTSGLAACPDEIEEPWAEAPSATAGLGDADSAFLVRIRRTANPSGLEDIPGESAVGPPVPLLFSRGTTIHGTAGAASIRRQGFGVRATSIAGALPALGVGLPAAGMYGATPFALTRSYFGALTNEPAAIALQADGTIGPAASPAGGFIATPLVAVGQAFPGPAPLACSAALAEIRGFVPIVEPIGPLATLRVVGFGRVELLWNCDTPAIVRISRAGQAVADANASPHLPGGLPDDLPPADVAELMERHRLLYWDEAGVPAHLGILVAGLVR